MTDDQTIDRAMDLVCRLGADMERLKDELARAYSCIEDQAKRIEELERERGAWTKSKEPGASYKDAFSINPYSGVCAWCGNSNSNNHGDHCPNRHLAYKPFKA